PPCPGAPRLRPSFAMPQDPYPAGGLRPRPFPPAEGRIATGGASSNPPDRRFLVQRILLRERRLGRLGGWLPLAHPRRPLYAPGTIPDQPDSRRSQIPGRLLRQRLLGKGAPPP